MPKDNVSGLTFPIIAHAFLLYYILCPFYIYTRFLFCYVFSACEFSANMFKISPNFCIQQWYKFLSTKL